MTPVDDAGRRFKPVSLAELGRDPRMVDPRFRLMLERTVRAQLMNQGHRAIAIVSFSILFVVVALGCVLLSASIGLPIGFTLLFMLAATCGLVIASRRYLLAKSLPQVIAVLVRHGVCPGCGYDLPVSDDVGMVRCPECSCGWRTDRVRPRHDRPAYGWGDRPTTAQSIRRFKWQIDLLGPKRAIDARDRTVPLVSSRLSAQVDAATPGDHRQRLLIAQHALRLEGLPLRAIVGLGVAGFGLAQIAWVLLDPSGIMSVGRAIVFGLCCLVIAATIFRSSLGVSRRSLIEILLNQSLCPTCAADLAAHLNDGAEARQVECPDCGAAWHPRQFATSPPPVA